MKKAVSTTALSVLAEGEGFEPPDLLQSTVFKTAALNRSATPPDLRLQKYASQRNYKAILKKINSPQIKKTLQGTNTHRLPDHPTLYTAHCPPHTAYRTTSRLPRHGPRKARLPPTAYRHRFPCFITIFTSCNKLI